MAQQQESSRKTMSRRRRQRDKQELPEDYPFREDMASAMHVELVVNDNSQLWVLHDRPFEAILQWAEFDEQDATLTFVMNDGKMQELGMDIPPQMAEIIIESKKVSAVYMLDGDIKDIGIIPVMVRQTVFH